MAAQPNRRQVSIRTETWHKAREVSEALSNRFQRKISISDTLDRGLRCLDDAHARGAWLSPLEAAPVLEERYRRRIVAVLAQFVARAMPERSLTGVTFGPDRIEVELDEGERLDLFLGESAMSATDHSIQ